MGKKQKTCVFELLFQASKRHTPTSPNMRWIYEPDVAPPLGKPHPHWTRGAKKNGARSHLDVCCVVWCLVRAAWCDAWCVQRGVMLGACSVDIFGVSTSYFASLLTSRRVWVVLRAPPPLVSFWWISERVKRFCLIFSVGWPFVFRQHVLVLSSKGYRKPVVVVCVIEYPGGESQQQVL